MKKLYILIILSLVSCLSNNTRKINTDRFGEIISDSIGNVNLQMTFADDNPYVIPIEMSNKSIDLSKIIDSVKLTRLETSENCLIGKIDKIVFDGNQYYILDKNIRKTLLIFDRNGKFVKKVGDIGKGPGEYLSPTDFVVNSSEIILIDGLGHKIMYYNTDGSYKNSFNLRYIVKEIFLTGSDSTFILRMGDNRHIKDIDGYELVAINRNGRILSKALNRGKNIPYSVGINGCYFNNKTTYHRPLSNEIHEIDDKTIRVKYLLDFDNHGLPSDFTKICDGNFEVFEKRYLKEYLYLLGTYIETDKYLILRISNKENPLSLFFYNLNSKEILSGVPIMNYGGKVYDIPGLISCSISDGIFVYDNKIIGSISPMLLEGLNNYPNEKKQLMNGGGDINISENPTIFTLTLK